jgi:hypothetical protein
MAKIKHCKKPGVPGEPHYVSDVPEKYIQRFNDKIEIQPNGCHYFMGNKQNSGYVNYYYYRTYDNKLRYITAHKFAALMSGKFTEDQVNNYCVLHNCDKNYAPNDISYRQCVRPEHLWSGTVQDNIQDCIAKGRYVKPPRMIGEDNPNATLTEKQALWVIEQHHKITQKRLAEILNCSVTAIEHIHRNISWQHLPRN